MRRRKAELAAAKKLMEEKAKQMAEVYPQPRFSCTQLPYKHEHFFHYDQKYKFFTAEADQLSKAVDIS